jgi:hypothetical protein
MGCAEGTGVLRRAQDDGKNRQRQRQKQKQGQKQIPFGDDNQRNNGDKNNDNGRNNNDNGRNKQRQGQKQIPFGDDNQRDNGNSRTNKGTTAAATAKYRDPSTASGELYRSEKTSSRGKRSW